MNLRMLKKNTCNGPTKLYYYVHKYTVCHTFQKLETLKFTWLGHTRMYTESSLDQQEIKNVMFVWSFLSYWIFNVSSVIPSLTYTDVWSYWQRAFIHRHLQRPWWPLSQKKENDQYPS